MSNKNNNSNKFNFNIELNNVNRDFFQGKFGNRPALDSLEMQELYKLHNNLVEQTSQDDNLVKFGAIEIGGAHPQVSTVFLNQDFLETYRKIREVAPNSALRPLWRGANGFMLKPKSIEELEFLLSQLSFDVAGNHCVSKKDELLRVKAFDSQGNPAEVKSTIDIVENLRKTFSVGVEIAVPYSNGVGYNHLQPKQNVYNDQLFIDKIIDSAALLKNIPNHLCHISLKDMTGELSANDAKRLIPKIIDSLAAKNLKIPFGLHLHDTGLAADAYIEAIKACKQKNWPISIDVVEGRETGFVSALNLHEKLKVHNINLLNKEQITTLQKIEKLSNQVAEKYKLIRANEALTGAELREFRIAGGAYASFAKAVKEADFAGKLAVSEKDALLLAGNGLNAVGVVMGYPFGVTPGFQNKQIAMLNYLNNLIEAKILDKNMDMKQMTNTILTSLNKKPEEQELAKNNIEKFFLNSLNDTVKEFLKGQMPHQVHPVIIANLGKRTGLLTDGKISDLNNKTILVENLQNKGLIKMTDSQLGQVKNILLDFKALEHENIDKFINIFKENNLIYAAPNGKEDNLYIENLQNNLAKLQKNKIINLDDKNLAILQNFILNMTIQNNLARSVVLDGDFEKNIRSPWLAEPDAKLYQDKQEYDRGVEKFRASLNPNPDRIELMRKQVLNGNIDFDLELELEIEQLKINHYVTDYVRKNLEAIKLVANDFDKIPFLIKDFYEDQQNFFSKEIIENGRKNLYSQNNIIDISFAYLQNEIANFSKQKNNNIARDILTKMNDARKIIEDVELRSPLAGKVVEVKVKPNSEVKKGQVICIIEAAKMEHKILAKCDGQIANLAIKNGDIIKKNNKIIDLVSKNQIKSVDLNNLNSKSQLNLVKEQSLYNKKLDELTNKIIKAEKLAATKLTNQDKITQVKEADNLLAKQGYNAAKMINLKNKKVNQKITDAIHVIGNRTGCAVKINGDLKSAGLKNIHLLYSKSDESTLILQNFDQKNKHLISDYNNQEEIIAQLEKFSQQNPHKLIMFHPGWGFLSENDEFVSKIEALNNPNIVFAGPASREMKGAGNKFQFRNQVEAVAPELNPKFTGGIGNENAREYGTVAELKDYVENGFSAQHKLHISYQKLFAQYKNDMGKDIMIKAVAGGGGRGIVPCFDENYQEFVSKILETRQTAQKLFANDEVMIEKRARGNFQHVEMQMVASNNKALTLGLRNCSVQNDGQKVAEVNLIKGDYPPELINKINLASQKIADKLAKEGYKGLGTLEMLVNPSNNEVVILEVNTRIQVEHGVTEEDIEQKINKRISLPLLNSHLTAPNAADPEQIMSDLYGINKQDINKLADLSTKRVTHFRINSKIIDWHAGKSTPSYFEDKMWFSNVIKQIAQKHKVNIIQGGLGDGSKDPQIGSILGEEKDAINALNDLLKIFRLSQISDRADNANSNLADINRVYPLLYNDKKNINPNFATHTIDSILEKVRDKELYFTGEKLKYPNELAISLSEVKEKMDSLTTQKSQKIEQASNLLAESKSEFDPNKTAYFGGMNAKQNVKLSSNKANNATNIDKQPQNNFGSSIYQQILEKHKVKPVSFKRDNNQDNINYKPTNLKNYKRDYNIISNQDDVTGQNKISNNKPQAVSKIGQKAKINKSSVNYNIISNQDNVIGQNKISNNKPQAVSKVGQKAKINKSSVNYNIINNQSNLDSKSFAEKYLKEQRNNKDKKISR